MNLVIVDDSLMILKHAEQILINSGVPVNISLCKSGKELIDRLGTEEIDIVLLDIVMPGISGIDVLKHIKATPEYRFIEVLMFSSISDKETLHECFEIGATDFIGKPIDNLEFVARIKSAVREKTLVKKSMEYLDEIQKQNAELLSTNSKLKQAQNQLVQQEKMASVGSLAAGVAHEINNPLGFITSNIASLQKYAGKYRLVTELAMNFVNSTELDQQPAEAIIPFRALNDYLQKSNFAFINEDIDEVFGDTTEGLQRVGTIVKGLRNFSRVDQIDDFSPYNLNEGIENTLIISRNEVKYSAEIVKKLSDVPDIYATGGQINQVLLNLILNAAAAVRYRYEPDLGIIEIATWAEEDSVHVTISDNGTGIKPEDVSSIFNPFFTTKPVGEGTGLGLSISYDIIVNKHHGRIDVNSEVNVGTEFHITLPFGSPVAL